MKNARNSSFELLRIILILMILIEHGNMWFIGSGYQSNLEHIAKCLVESVCIGSVNVFVMISGWFGIRSSLGKIGDLVFMILFCTLPLLAVALSFGWLPLSALASSDGACDYILGGNAYWFVADYIGLMIFAPLLNKGIEGLSHSQFKKLLIVGYLLIAVYDFALRSSALGTEGGYSVTWFIYLYLLARYLRIYGFKFLDRYCRQLFVASVVLQTVLFYFGLIGLRYTNPLIILEAVSLILIFKDWNFHSSALNKAAKGVLMAYLIHMQPVLLPYITYFLRFEYASLGYFIYMAEVVALAVCVFLAAIPLNWLQSKLYQKIKKCV